MTEHTDEHNASKIDFEKLLKQREHIIEELEKQREVFSPENEVADFEIAYTLGRLRQVVPLWKEIAFKMDSTTGFDLNTLEGSVNELDEEICVLSRTKAATPREFVKLQRKICQLLENVLAEERRTFLAM